MKCNLIVPGFAKSGTSSLHEYLDLHPSICMSTVKEPHYFAIDSVHSRGEQWHDDLFRASAEECRWFGESSTLYSIWEPALLKIRKSLHNPKLIVLLRHPVERLLSHYRWMYALDLERESLIKALEREAGTVPSPENSRRGCYPWYIRASRYSYFCELIVALFGQDNVLLIRSEELASDPQAVLDACFSHLGLASIPVTDRIFSNQTSEKTVQRKYGLGRILKPVPKHWRDRLDPDARLRSAVKGLLGQTKRIAPPPGDREIEQLQKLLAEDVAYFDAIPRIVS